MSGEKSVSLLEMFKKTPHEWIIEILIVVLITYLLTVFFNITYHKLLPKAQKSSKIWDDAFLVAAYRPFKLLLWLLGLSLVFEIVHVRVYSIPFFTKFSMFFQILLVAILTTFLIRFGKGLERSIRNHQEIAYKIDITSQRAIANIYQIIILTLGVLTALQVVGIPLSGVIAFGGIGGIAVGFAAKDMLANLFGGVMIFLDRPFAIGDRVKSTDREIEGVVEHIGWRTTCIRNIEQSPIYVPNSLFSTIIIENKTRIHLKRIELKLGISYEDLNKIPEVTVAIQSYLKNHPEIDHHKEILVALINLGSYSLDIQIEAYTRATDKIHFHQVQHAIFLHILSLLETFGAKCSFPTQTIFLENSPL